eukprot:tig00020537_g10232.t1
MAFVSSLVVRPSAGVVGSSASSASCSLRSPARSSAASVARALSAGSIASSSFLASRRFVPIRAPASFSAGRAFFVSAASVADVQKQIDGDKVVVFSKTHCPYCSRVKGLFAELNVPAKIVELDEVADGSAIQATLLEITGQRTVPNVFIGGKHVGGCDNTMAKLADGSLKTMLADVGISISI